MSNTDATKECLKRLKEYLKQIRNSMTAEVTPAQAQSILNTEHMKCKASGLPILATAALQSAYGNQKALAILNAWKSLKQAVKESQR